MQVWEVPLYWPPCQHRQKRHYILGLVCLLSSNVLNVWGLTPGLSVLESDLAASQPHNVQSSASQPHDIALIKIKIEEHSKTTGTTSRAFVVSQRGTPTTCCTGFKECQRWQRIWGQVTWLNVHQVWMCLKVGKMWWFCSIFVYHFADWKSSKTLESHKYIMQMLKVLLIY